MAVCYVMLLCLLLECAFCLLGRLLSECHEVLLCQFVGQGLVLILFLLVRLGAHHLYTPALNSFPEFFREYFCLKAALFYSKIFMR